MANQELSGGARPSGRAADEMRPVRITRRFTCHAEGSVLMEVGGTKVICTASIEERVPEWMRGRGSGWVTAEYGLLPRATGTRCEREAAKGRQSGRTQEIQRLIGRSLRAVVDRKALGERMVILDCDVIQADGGTRCAAITGAWVALADAVSGLMAAGKLEKNPILDSVAAVSAGICKGGPVLDLDYAEDSAAQTDMNFVMTGKGGIVEVQGTAEGAPFSEGELLALLALAKKGLGELAAAQRAALRE